MTQYHHTTNTFNGTTNEQKIDLSLFPPDVLNMKPSSDDILMTYGNKTLRKIFHNVEWNSFENEKYEELNEFLKKGDIQIPDWFGREDRMRYVQGCGFVIKNAVAAIAEHLEWRPKWLPLTVEDVIKEVEAGVMYWHGRDSSYRPLLVVRVKAIDTSTMHVENVIRLTVYILEYALNNLFIPGKIENWNILFDLDGVSLMSLPYMTIKDITAVLQSNYRARLGAMFVVNAPAFVATAWKVVKAFMEPETAAKIHIFRGDYHSTLFSFYNESQIEEKYGGSVPNFSKYNPPVFMPPAPWHITGTHRM